MQFSIHCEYSLGKEKLTIQVIGFAILSDTSLRLIDVMPSRPDAPSFNCLITFFHFIVRGRGKKTWTFPLAYVSYTVCLLWDFL